MRRTKRQCLPITLIMLLFISIIALAFMVGCGGNAAPAKDPEVTSVELDKSAYVMNVGDEFTLTATVLPETATDKTVKWSVTQGDAVTVDNGKVTAVKAGEAIVTAIADDGGANASCAITVKDNITAVSFDVTEKKIEIDEEFVITPTVMPSALVSDLIWSVEPAGIVKVTDGKVTGLAQGTAKVVASDRTGTVKAECTVTVEMPASLELDVTEKTLNIDESFTLAATVLPESVTEAVAWSVEPAGIVTVKNGVVTGVEEGTATVTASIRNGAVKAVCRVTVKLNMTIAFDITEKSIHIGEEFDITATVTPVSKLSLVTWSVVQSDDFIALENGKVTALKEGTAVVKASAVNGKFYAECTVTVLPHDYVELDKETYTMNIGDDITLVADHTPSTGVIVWTVNPAGVVTVENGKVTAVTKGIATVTATLQGTEAYASCVITVEDPSEIKSIAFPQSAYFTSITKTIDIPVVFTPATSEAGKTVTYTSDRENIVTIDEYGTITAVSAGKATVTASVGGFNATCEITVNLLANDYNTQVTWDETTGAPIVRTTDNGNAVNAIDTGKETGEYVYYAEATLNVRQIESAGWGLAIGMVHSGSRTNNTAQADFMYDKLHMYVFSQTDGGAFNTGYWHRQGVNYNTADAQLTLNIYNDNLGNCYNDIIKLFNNNTSLVFGIARDHDFVYTFINGVIIERMPIAATLKEMPTFPGIYFEAGYNAANYMTNIKYICGDDARAVIENAYVAFRYSRTTNGFKSSEISADGLSARFNNFTDSYYNSSVSASGSFDGNTEMEFDLTVNSGANGHIFINISSTPLTTYSNTNIGDDGNTVVGGGIWVYENKMQGNDLYQDTATNTTSNKTWAGFGSVQASVHVKISLAMDESGIITSTVIMTSGDRTVYSKTQTSTKTYTGKDFRIHFLSESSVDYTVSNFKFACAKAA